MKKTKSKDSAKKIRNNRGNTAEQSITIRDVARRALGERGVGLSAGQRQLIAHRVSGSVALRDVLIEQGPVLLQTPRQGYVTSLSCDRCRTPARCRACSGPLRVQAAHLPPSCTWCGQDEPAWACAECGGLGTRKEVAWANSVPLHEIKAGRAEAVAERQQERSEKRPAKRAEKRG